MPHIIQGNTFSPAKVSVYDGGMNIGQQHLSARARIFSRLEPFPSADTFKRFLDYLMYGVGIIQPIALVPQVISIYYYGQTSGVSLSTWFLLGFFNALWALYGYVHREMPILISNVLMTALDLIIVFGVVWH
jgi:uncharacterized protein with PQ loop repeat